MRETLRRTRRDQPEREPNLTLRICIVTPYDLVEEGGVKRHAVHLADRLRRMGDEVVVAGPLSQDEARAGVRGFGGVVNVPFNGAANRMALLTPPWSVRRFFAENRFDVVHLHEPFVPMLPYYALWLTPDTAHVVTFHMYAEHEGTAWRLIRQGMGRVMGPAVQRAIAVSRPAADFAARAWGGPLAVIPNGVPTSLFRPPDDVTPPAREGPTRLLFVGNWRDERKGLS